MIQSGSKEQNSSKASLDKDEKRNEAWVETESSKELTALEKVIVLKTAQIFSSIPDNILFDLATRTREQTLNQGEILFEAGDSDATMYVVVEGKLKVHHSGKTLAILSHRAVLGEMAALSSEPRSASITTEEPTHLLALDQLYLLEVMRYRPEIGREIIHTLVQRLRSML